jgi:hypothetical protein
MIISSVRYAFTRNLGNYESVKVEVEAAPSENQNPETVISELRAYVEANLPGAANTVEVTVKAPEPVRKSVPRVKKADKLKAPGTIDEAVTVAGELTDGTQLAVFYNACRDGDLANHDAFQALSKAVADRCQQICEIGSPERAAIGAALKAEKLRRESTN